MAEKVSAGDPFSLSGSVAGKGGWPGLSKLDQNASRVGLGRGASRRLLSWLRPLLINFLWFLSSFLEVSHPYFVDEEVFYIIQSPGLSYRNTMETVCYRLAFCLRITLQPHKVLSGR